MLPDGRVVTGGGDDGGRVLVWDPAEPGAGPVELGRHEDGVGAVAVLPDGRVVTGGRLRRRAGAGVGPGGAGRRPGRARPPRGRGGGGGGAAGRAGGHRRLRAAGGCWCGTRRSRAPARSSSAATRAGWGRWRCCRTGGWSPAATTTGRVLVWDPAEPGAGPVELGRHAGGVGAVAVLPDGRVVTGGDDDRVRLWNVQSNSPGTLLACSAHALATSLSPSGARLFIGHAAGRNFMLGGTPSDTEHAWSPATCEVTRCNNRHECPQGPG